MEENKKPKKSNKNNARKIILTILIILILTVAVFLIIKLTLNSSNQDDSNQSNQSNFEDWLHDNCNCTERNNWKCPKGYYLVPEQKLCERNDNKTYTNVLLGCSKYDCNGTIYNITI